MSALGTEALYDSHFAQTMNTPTMISSSHLTPSFDGSAPTTIKMEDLQVPFDPEEHSVRSTASPSPSSTHGSESKPVKKRKSWGQVLPEPKTNLPPRKRAKTEDEKEQRRIERVKRNRLAAHNSRERKRQEYDLIQKEKEKLEDDLKAAQAIMARMNAELKLYRKKYPGEVPETSYDLPNIASDYESFSQSSPRTTDTVCPAQTSASFPSPVSMTMDSMDSPRDSSCQPETPNFSEAAADFDQTRYPAAILCDLQCQSKPSAAPASRLAAIWAFLSLFNLTLPLTKSLLTTFSTSTPSLSTTLPMEQALWTPLLAWAALTTSSSRRPSSAASLTTSLAAFLTSLTTSSPTCRQPLAQLLLATGLSQRTSSARQVARSKRVARRAGLDGAAAGRRRRASLRTRQMGVRRFGLTKEIFRSLGAGSRLHDRRLDMGRRTET